MANIFGSPDIYAGAGLSVSDIADELHDMDVAARAQAQGRIAGDPLDWTFTRSRFTSWRDELRDAADGSDDSVIGDHELPEIEPSEEMDFESQRAAWMMAKGIVALSTEYGGDLVKYLEQTGVDEATKARVAGFIPAALEAHRLKDMPVGAD